MTIVNGESLWVATLVAVRDSLQCFVFDSLLTKHVGPTNPLFFIRRGERIVYVVSTIMKITREASWLALQQ